MAKISDQDKKYLLSLTPDDINFKTLSSILGDTVSIENKKVAKKGKSRMSAHDTFTLAANEYFNKSKVETNVGLLIYNKFIIEPRLKEVVPYVNEPVDAKQLKKIESYISKALLNDRIKQEDYVDYLDRTQWLGMKMHAILSGSFTMNTVRPNPKVMAQRDKLFKDNKEAIDRNDVIVGVRIEKELTGLAGETLKNDQGLNLYKSGARGSFDNNFKNISVMRGPVFDPVSNKYEIVKSNFVEGMRKDEIATYANTVITGSYPKAVGTQVSGYLSKQITAAMQSVVLDVAGSDCGTKNFLKITITPDLKNDLVYRYIVEGSKIVYLDDDNIDKYIGKEVKLRSPMYCIADKLCNKCAGEMYYKLGLTNIGLTATKVSSTLLNLNMKKFHSGTIHTTKVNIQTLTV